MSELLLRLAERIRDECNDLDLVVERILEGWQRAQQTQDDFYMDSVALNLHSFYNGIERIFERIAATLDGKVPEGANWHQALLNQMATEITHTRPAVISEETQEALYEYRGFRHIVRNIYTFHFDSSKIQSIVEPINEVFIQVRAEMTSFADFLEQQAEDG